jgi:hypothetical protein
MVNDHGQLLNPTIGGNLPIEGPQKRIERACVGPHIRVCRGVWVGLYLSTRRILPLYDDAWVWPGRSRSLAGCRERRGGVHQCTQRRTTWSEFTVRLTSLTTTWTSFRRIRNVRSKFCGWMHTARLPQFADIRRKKSHWHAVHSITLGTSSSELEHLNGRPFPVTLTQ